MVTRTAELQECGRSRCQLRQFDDIVVRVCLIVLKDCALGVCIQLI